jgi:hypothetical protein
MLAICFRTYAMSLLIVMVVAPHILFTQNYVSTMYCAILGKEDAAQEYQVIVHEALQAFGIHDFEGVSVKKLSSFPKKFLGDNVISFSMQGIWIDENLLTDCPFEEMIFTLYHEAAHYAFRHHAKEALLLVPATLLFYSIPHLTVNIINKNYRMSRFGYIGIMSILMIGLLDRALIRPAVRVFERKAEKEAARALCRSGKQCIVQAHIDYLQSLIMQGEKNTGIWWDSLSDRINSITACLHEFAAE